MRWSVSGRIIIGIIALLGLVIGAWYATNYQPQRVGVIFTLLSLATIVVLFLERAICSYFGQPYDGGEATLTARSVLVQIVLGLAFGFGIVFLSSRTGLSIGLPSVQQSIGGMAFTSIIGAPIIEEPFFRFVVPFLLYLIFSKVTGSRWAGAVISLFASAVLFALYHWAAYGATLLVSGAFVGAGIFATLLLLAQLVWNAGRFSSKSASVLIIAFVVSHAVFNAYIYARPFFIAGGAA